MKYYRHYHKQTQTKNSLSILSRPIQYSHTQFYVILFYPFLPYHVLFCVMSYPSLASLHYAILSCPLKSYPSALSYPILSYPSLLHPIKVYLILSSHVLLHAIFSCSILSHPIICYSVLSDPIRFLSWWCSYS